MADSEQLASDLSLCEENCKLLEDEIERNRAAISELVAALDSLCLRIDNEGASPMDWAEYDSACAVLEKHSTTKEQ